MGVGASQLVGEVMLGDPPPLRKWCTPPRSHDHSHTCGCMLASINSM